MEKKIPILNTLRKSEINYKDYTRSTDEEIYYYGLIEKSPAILADYHFLGEMLSIRQYCEYKFSFSDRVKWALTTFSDGKLIRSVDSTDILKKFRNLYADSFCEIFWQVREGLPLYNKTPNGWSEIPENEKDELIRNIDNFTIGEDFEHIKLYPDMVHLDNLYFSTKEMDMLNIFFCQYESSSSIELAIRKQAFLLYRDGKLFDTDRKPTKQLPIEINCKEREGLLKTIGALTLALINAKGNTFKHGEDKININAVAQHILNLVENDGGLGDRAVRGRITEAIELVSKNLDVN